MFEPGLLQVLGERIEHEVTFAGLQETECTGERVIDWVDIVAQLHVTD